jgi:hypothetical protein
MFHGRLGICVPPLEAVSALASISRWFESSVIGRVLPLNLIETLQGAIVPAIAPNLQAG